MRRFKKGTAHREAVDLAVELAVEIGDELDATYAPIQKAEESRYTFGPLYSPDTEDAHGEYALGDDLQKAIWQYMDMSREGGVDLRLRKQHNKDAVIGRVVELVQWPYELTAPLSVAGVQKTFHLPAGTVYTGVLWTPESWPDVKKGAITGLSMGGRAVRIAEPSIFD